MERVKTATLLSALRGALGGEGLCGFDEVVAEVAGDCLVGHLALVDIETFAEVRMLEQGLAGGSCPPASSRKATSRC